MSPRRPKASSSMAAAAMPLAELEQWLQARVDQHPAATGLPMLDGYVAAIVAGPVSMSPLDWICPLLAIDADAFNHGGTPEFAAISAVALRHNEISQILSTTPNQFAPMHRRQPNGVVDPRPWCQGFYAAMRLRLSAWAPLLDASNVNHRLLLPILLHCRDDQAGPLLGPPRTGRETRDSLRNAHLDIPAAVEAMRQYWMPIRYARAR
ncbi:uncharacterized protein ABIF38_008591 [Bradyrhizobium japonicum]|jgi:uncharacterized protein|uniref:YecA family protein n=7 Tax=Nitrobacteraceae TaxID=41294 RepID=A0ABV4EUH7_BRAEL|nr:UPF0149 family protein [Bradyrhizobium elkanii]MCP1729093.1 uncharacterized protein [Bradyrhizobium elkanii]MCP1755595.1 uncharacterized protein [Bradyrhizobium elkanii]MCP1755835.1 uncharacterized protein [Bradyrhizobium elkanii]MCS3573222.1 uncharacterized protein [Bradyrhizobium elkanii]MCS3594087.1 uncharacterized protein [Bradyrhizobium elkanii]